MKTKVAIAYGGNTFEHEVSKMTSSSILENIDRNIFDVSEIYIDKEGKFDEGLLKDVDVVFIATHGPNYEDGKFQKFLEGKGVRYTGAGVECSRLSMNKTEMHRVHKNSGLPVVENRGFRKGEEEEIRNYCREIGYPVFVKSDNAGSSIGITPVAKDSDLDKALNSAYECDENICIEKGVPDHREYEVAVLGNGEDLTVSEPGEILANGQFYSYDTKYFHPFATTTNISDMTAEKASEIKDLAKKAYISAGCKGYARMDFLADSKGKIYISEISTLPGFTKISMFPQMMLATGLSYKDLITKIIELAME